MRPYHATLKSEQIRSSVGDRIVVKFTDSWRRDGGFFQSRILFALWASEPLLLDWSHALNGRVRIERKEPCHSFDADAPGAC